MTVIFANRALLATGWVQNTRLTLRDGAISAIETGVKPQAGDQRVDTVLPALANLHSHSFQRAMAGMTEYRKAGRDSFWTWRDLMYRFTAHLTPEQIEAIAALVFLEMQEAGYASVGEFHYLHHQKSGSPYDNLSEHSDRIMAAAQLSGIGLTHLPVLYSYAGVGKQPLEPGQMRFGNDVDRFCQLVDQARAHAKATLPADCRVGIAPHSLRATAPDDLVAVLAAQGNTSNPVHIHIAEQPKEVQEVRAGLGARPVEWLLDNAPVDQNWCLIHATHMTEPETRAMAGSGAVAGLCPVTEANLGDGPFNGPTYLEAGGAFGVGSDSNVLISLTEELRTLEYSQRLRDLSRNVLVQGEGSVGHALYSGAAQGGAQALGRTAGTIAPGQLADLVAIDSNHPSLCALGQDQLLDGLVFAAKDHVVTDLWSAGRHCVQAGRHIARDQILTRYRSAMAELLAAID
ncbi:formimidoylglutamate deiminase [Pseudophaeobacter flagellatus]|uniref:formimidoylglutamate deiminase n=1 Tax=Pseudophaeobacter flagellatus TaxID=2899119 RepID=UPI001E64B69D|nr:formimidoylglutamate deiminase [Pseudophaeobacter flagellatus]MCD9149623.1 formimidoylglutamate deiminase [Pseudophaeobacter flagellatus]